MQKKRSWVKYTMLVALLLAILPLLTYAKNEYSVNVIDFGAKGDGISDDTAAFVNALTLIESRRGGNLVIPEGIYIIDIEEPLTIKSNISIQGQDKPMLVFKNMSKEYRFGYEALSISGNNVRVDGIIVNGNNSVIRGVSVRPGSKNVTITNLTIENITQSADTKSPLYNALITGVFIYDNTSDITISHSTVRNVKAIHKDPVARGIFVYSQDGLPVAQNIKILHNRIYNITPREDADGIHFDQASKGSGDSNSLIANNVIYNVAKRGIKIATPGIVVQNNHIINSYNKTNKYLFPQKDPLPQDMFGGISVYASNVKVAENQIDGIGSYYAGIEADMNQKNILIIGNTIKNGDKADVLNTNGIRLGTVTDFVVSRNMISRMHTGIYTPLYGAQKGQIKENTMKGVEFGVRLMSLPGAKNSNVELLDNIIASRQEEVILDDQIPINLADNHINSSLLQSYWID